jgi:hypothetical protein
MTTTSAAAATEVTETCVNSVMAITRPCLATLAWLHTTVEYENNDVEYDSWSLLVTHPHVMLLVGAAGQSCIRARVGQSRGEGISLTYLSKIHHDGWW